MGRAAAVPGSVGVVSTALLGRGPDGAEVPVPLPRTADGQRIPVPRAWKVGQTVMVTTNGRTVPYLLTRWRGMCQVYGLDGAQHTVRRWQSTRAAAESWTRAAAAAKVEELVATSSEVAPKDEPTTVAALLGVYRDVLADETTDLHARSRADYQATISALLGEPLRPRGSSGGVARNDSQLKLNRAFESIAGREPADVRPADLRQLFHAIAAVSGRSTALKVRTIMSHVFRIAVERNLVPLNPVRALTGTQSDPVIPNKKIIRTGIDHRTAPTAEQYQGLIDGLRSDPEAGPMLPGSRRLKSPHGRAGSQLGNPKDVLDLTILLFATGARLGELIALTWGDIAFNEDGTGSVTITKTLIYTPGEGVRPQTTTKTGRARRDSGAREVYLVAPAIAVLRRRADAFGVNLHDAGDLARPVFPSPQRPTQYRDPGNLSKAIRKLYTRHGLPQYRSHVGRKFVVNHLIRQGVPITEVAKVVGWSTLGTVEQYADVTSAPDPIVRSALERSVVADELSRVAVR